MTRTYRYELTYKVKLYVTVNAEDEDTASERAGEEADDLIGQTDLFHYTDFVTGELKEVEDCSADYSEDDQ